MTPRSSCPGGESTPLRGANLRLIYRINTVAENCAGGDFAAHRPRPTPAAVAPQLPTAWVTLGKQTWATSPRAEEFHRLSGPTRARPPARRWPFLDEIRGRWPAWRRVRECGRRS